VRHFDRQDIQLEIGDMRSQKEDLLLNRQIRQELALAGFQQNLPDADRTQTDRCSDPRSLRAPQGKVSPIRR
jgi:hypothetical protein